MQTEFEKYLNNDMNADERKLFEQKLADDPVLTDQFRSYEGMLDALQTQMLRERIAAATANGGGEDPPEKTTSAKRAWILGILLLIIVAVILYFISQSPGKPNPPEQKVDLPSDELPQDILDFEKKPPENPAENELEEDETVREKKKPTKPSTRPIAEGPIPEPSNLSGGVRGLSTESSEWTAFIESVWETRFKPQPGDFNNRFSAVADLLKAENYTDAFVQLYMLERESPENDTLAYLKGYCLLEMKEGAEALSYFEKIDSEKNWEQELQWYSVLAHLLSGNKVQAVEKAAVITAEKDHPFREQASLIYE